MNVPTDYTDENAPEANKAVYKEYQRIIKSINKTARGCVLNQFGFKVWEESDEDYQARMNQIFYEVK